MHKIFWIGCAALLAIQCIVVLWVWISTGEISYKGPRDLFGAAPQDRIRRADTPVWYWCNIATVFLIHAMMLAWFMLLIGIRRF